jgi:hypothetical protein
LHDEWAMLSFGELARSDWPLKAAVDELFGISMSTNSLSIEDPVLEITRLIGKGVRGFWRKERTTKFREMDFAQIFVLTLIAVLTSGLSVRQCRTCRRL